LKANGKSRRHLYFADNLRIALTILVIAHHVGQAYGPTGGAWPIQEQTRAAVLGPFFTVNRSFFMSLFFMLSGYFMVMSYGRHGPRRFLTTRVLRLGVPLAVFFLLIIPIQQYLCHLGLDRIHSLSFWKYYTAIYFGIGGRPADWAGPMWPEMNFAHLWYVEHLLIASVAYALLRLIWKQPIVTDSAAPKPPPYSHVVVFALVLALASAIVRRWHPIDRWVGFLGFIQVAFADVPRDLSFFVLGAIAYRRRWFLGIPARTGYVWLTVGLTAAVLWYTYSLGIRHTFRLTGATMRIVYPLWEAFLCCGMCIGLLVLFRERFDVQRWWSKAMARDQYAAYLFHGAVVVLVQYLIRGLTLPPFVKFLLATAASVPLTFLLADLLRKPAFMRRIL
jgi:surface polysaccharide O-acyltransferase-like enzyme